MIKEKWDNYKANTPEFWRKLGDSLLIVSTTGGVPAILLKHEYVGIGLFLIGVAGKFLTTFFKK